MWYTYVLKSKNFRKSYVGSTNDLQRRLEEHNTGKSSYTRNYLPWELVYSEEYSTEMEARQRERYLKSSSGRKRILKKLFS